MLTSFSMQNFALFKHCEIDFKKGFNVILGQSGAGKSIIIDALNFVLGGKADKNLIRTGEKTMRVDAVFSDLSAQGKAILDELAIDTDDGLIISRTLSEDGKSNIRVNGAILSLKDLKLITENLIDFCGQHDSVGLINSNNHLMFLDKFIGNEAGKDRAEIEKSYDELMDIDKKIKALGGDESERARLKEILQFQITEIENANLLDGEEEELRTRYKFISSAERIYEKVSEALKVLDGTAAGVTTQLFEAKNTLKSLSEFENLQECSDRLENSYYEVKDVVDTLEDVLSNTDFDQNELERIDARLDLIKGLERKYGATIADVLVFCEKIKKQLNDLDDSEFMLEKLNKERERVSAELEEKCQKLSDLRKKYALELEQKIENELNELQMKGTRFKVDFERAAVSKKGFDQVKFIFSANLGQNMKDLSKTASGGELSRLLLAFKNIMLDKESVSTVVFDEIDSGISGKTAGKVAEKLENISNYFQIICITHTPVVASKGNAYLLVTKYNEDNTTLSKVEEIANDDVVYQIASLIDGSEKVSDTAINHSKQLLKK